MSVIFRGLPACTCQAAWIPFYERELQRRSLLTGQLRIFQLIGGNPSSGGTHTGGGAADLLDLPGDQDVWVARQMGADATWARPFNWDGDGGIAHIHSVLRGCPHLSASALAQVGAVDRGGDGLIGDASDTGPRPLSGRTWQQGIEWQRQQEDDMPAPKDWDAEDWAAFRQHLLPDMAAAVWGFIVRKANPKANPPITEQDAQAALKKAANR